MTSVLLFGLLFGFVPGDSDLQGPPQTWLSRTPARQIQLSLRPTWRAFEERWPGQWSVRWDERTGTPRFLGAPGTSVSEVDLLVDDIARLSGVAPTELTTVGLSGGNPNGRQFLRWTRNWKGAPVEGDEVVVVVLGGRISGVWVRLTPVRLQDVPRTEESVLVLPLGPSGDLVRPGEFSTGVQVALVTTASEDDVTTHRDRSGKIVLQYDERRFSSVTAWREERTVDDDLEHFIHHRSVGVGCVYLCLLG